MSMDIEEYRKRKAFAGELKPSMTRRNPYNDYEGRQMYMITMVTEGRLPLFGNVTGNPLLPVDNPDGPHIELSPLGKAVAQCWDSINAYHHEITVVALQVMPDHIHGILFVRERMEKHLGMALRGFKIACGQAFRELCPEQAAKATAVQSATMALQHVKQDRTHGFLFAPNYNDRTLLRRGQLQAWLNYLSDNPRRLLMKRLHPEFLRVQSHLQFGNVTFSAIGNRDLLLRPYRLQIQCSRSMTPDQIDERRKSVLAECAHGAVLVSPSISKGEKIIMRAAFEAGRPVIVLKENGFQPLTKPSGKAFDACARGQMLMLAPWEHHNDKRVIKRSQCLDLNSMAAMIAHG